MSRNIPPVTGCNDGQNLAQPTSQPRRIINRRSYKRRYFREPVRFMTSDRREHQGMMIDIAATGVRINSNYIPMIGDAVIAYIDHFGRFEGAIVRRTDDTFSMEMNLSPAKADRLARAMDRFFENYSPKAPTPDRRVNQPDRRAYIRRSVIGAEDITAFTTEGTGFKCTISNLSLGGAEIITETQLLVGQTIQVGTLNGKVTRKTETGYAIERN